MNALTTNNGAGLVPQNFEQAMRFAEMMAKSKMVPKHFQMKPEECLVIIEQAMRWEMSPYAVIQCASMIHERPMYEGKLVAAVVNARGRLFGLHGRLSYTYEGADATRKVIVSGVIDGKAETVDVILKDAKTTNTIWEKQPDQQLAYHGARMWARRYMPELMLGVYAPDEFDAEPAPTPYAGTTIEARAEPPAPPPKPEHKTQSSIPITEWANTTLKVTLDTCDSLKDIDDVLSRKAVVRARQLGTIDDHRVMDFLIAAAKERVAPPDRGMDEHLDTLRDKAVVEAHEAGAS